MTKNATNTILMIRPARFAMNVQTAVDNFYQDQDASPEGANENAQIEFDRFVDKLTAIGVETFVIQDVAEPHTPDSIFPNNWISMHADSRVVLYPMKAENRRLERLENIYSILSDFGFDVQSTVDYSDAELENIYLEGTGSIIFDHDNKTAYMARSQRADEFLLDQVCEDLGYTSIVFSAFQDTPEGRKPIYHTNVMMCITDAYVLMCLDAIDNEIERKMVVERIYSGGKEIIEITEEQKHQFAGNMLLVKGAQGALYVVMSTSAFNALTLEQKKQMQQDHQLLHTDLTTIETLGGGSARCMLAEIYLPKQVTS